MFYESYKQIEQLRQEFFERLNCGLSPELAERLFRILQEDGPTFVHSLYTSFYVERMAYFAGYGNEEVRMISSEALLHDIGKLVPSVRSLIRRRDLSDREWAEVRKHPLYGGMILRELGLPFQYANVAEQHHENYDGSGHPYGLSGEPDGSGGAFIHPHAALIRIADTYHSAQLTYDKAHLLGPDELGNLGFQTSRQYAASIILKGEGIKFHPAFIEPFKQFYQYPEMRTDAFFMQSSANIY